MIPDTPAYALAFLKVGIVRSYRRNAASKEITVDILTS